MAEKRKRDILWEVGCEGHTDAWVIAENWELATVEAAKVWGLPWGKLVAEMRCVRSWRALRHICQRCGRYFNAEGMLCDACKKTLETEREQTALRLKKTWYMGAKEAPFGT